MKGSCLVKFKNLLEEECEDTKFGILLEDNTVLCLCCGGTFEEEDYKIIEKYIGYPWLIENFTKMMEKQS